ncbi:MAG: MFS transporter [Deltaproteobacteria bacterium]|nr:MFS transporter [Deltaproteobacteria bacterium]
MNRYNLLLFYLYQFFSKASFQRGIFILYLTELGFSGAQIGTLQALLFWSNLLSEVPTGIFGDRYGRKLSVITGLALFAVNGIGQVLFGGFLPFLVIYALQGIAFAFCSGSDEAMIYDYLKSIGAESKYIKVQSRLRAIGSLSLGTAMCVGGVLQGYSWKAVYCSYSLAMLAGLMSIIFFSYSCSVLLHY